MEHNLNKTYDPTTFEKDTYIRWEASGHFNPDKLPSAGDEPFFICMPPPNVTGVLHQGHALFASIEDTYTRWKRMLGFRTLWLPGTDHAGIATQLMVEKQLESEGSSRRKVGREEFLRRTWQWKEEHSGIIQQQLRALGSSCDWSRERFTMDAASNLAVRESFIRLYHDGLIYRGERIVNWSTGLQTAVSDLEVEKKPVEGALYYVKYALEDTTDFLIVATTRPETIYADVAVAIHPDDERFSDYHGKRVKVPLTNRTVPIILDEYVDKEFGTGVLKITPGHDHNDWAIGQRHRLPSLSVIERDGKLNQHAGECAGLDVKSARKKTIELLETNAILVKKEKYTHEVGHCQRSGAVIEPLISMQWWLDTKPLAEKALHAAKRESGDYPALRFFPDFWTKTYFEWLENIQDWCISRQLWWGHQIPAWHCKECQAISVPNSAQDADPLQCKKCGSAEILQDEDVLDTWYSSGLWPISTLGWPEKTRDLSFFYPQTKFSDSRTRARLHSLMETGSDILFFWVARMMMMCTYFMDGRIPFEDVYLHAMVRDSKGQKMSKTKGNVVDPMDIIHEHGADALRLTLLVLSGGGRNVNFDIKRLEGYKSFINKLWNACRFTLPYFSQENSDFFRAEWTAEDFAECPPEGAWILHRLNETVTEVNRQLEQYRFDLAFNAIYQFTWYEFCDWYVEFAKLQDLNRPLQQKILFHSLFTILKLLHPMAPFVTEEIFSFLPGNEGKMLMVCEYPLNNSLLIAEESTLEQLRITREIIEGIRNFRTENKISPKQEINVYLQAEDKKLWAKIEPTIRPLTKIKDAQIKKAPSGPNGRVAVAGFEFHIPLGDLVNKEAEITRLTTEVQRLRTDLEFVEKRLANKNFVDKAKPELVEKEKERANSFSDKIASLEDALKRLKK